MTHMNSAVQECDATKVNKQTVAGIIKNINTKKSMIKTQEQYYLPGKLHTEILEEQYGEIDVQLLYDDNIIREVLLLDEKNIARTYAITFRSREWQGNEGMEKINELIRSGASIGKTFKRGGYDILKNVIEVYVTNIPEWLMLAFEEESKTAKTRITEFLVRKNNEVFNYGIIAEVYSPHFSKPEVTKEDKAQINIATQILKKLGYTSEEIWMSISGKPVSLPFNDLYTSFITDVKTKVDIILKEVAPLMCYC